MLFLQLELKYEQEDITTKFHHTTLEEGEHVFVELPLHLRKKGKGLKLKRITLGS